MVEECGEHPFYFVFRRMVTDGACVTYTYRSFIFLLFCVSNFTEKYLFFRRFFSFVFFCASPIMGTDKDNEVAIKIQN